MQAASKVGMLVVAFVVLLAAAYAFLGKSLFAPKTTTYYAEFADATGVSQGANVLMAGVKVGTVAEINLASPTMAKLRLEISPEHPIPQGSHAVLLTSLIGFGDNPVQIVPPTEALPGYLAPGGTLAGQKGSPLEGILPGSKETLAELNKTLGATRKLLEDQKLVEGFKTVLATADRTAAQFGVLAQNVNSLVVQNRATFRHALAQADRAIADVRTSVSIAKTLMEDPKLRAKVAAMLDSLSVTGDKARQLVTGLNEFVNDPVMQDRLKATVGNVQTITDSGTRIAASAEEIAKNGVVVSQKAIELADKAEIIADEARATLKKLEGFFQKVPTGNVLKGMQGRMDVIGETEPNRVRTDLSLMVPFKDFNLHVGLFDAFETNKLTAQIGQRFGTANEYRYGIYAGKPGFGVNYELAPSLFLEGDLFGLNETRFDLRARYDFGESFVGWLGINRVFDGNAPMIGVGFRR